MNIVNRTLRYFGCAECLTSHLSSQCLCTFVLLAGGSLTVTAYRHLVGKVDIVQCECGLSVDLWLGFGVVAF